MKKWVWVLAFVAQAAVGQTITTRDWHTVTNETFITTNGSYSASGSAMRSYSASPIWMEVGVGFAAPYSDQKVVNVYNNTVTSLGTAYSHGYVGFFESMPHAGDPAFQAAPIASPRTANVCEIATSQFSASSATSGTVWCPAGFSGRHPFWRFDVAATASGRPELKSFLPNVDHDNNAWTAGWTPSPVSSDTVTLGVICCKNNTDGVNMVIPGPIAPTLPQLAASSSTAFFGPGLHTVVANCTTSAPPISGGFVVPVSRDIAVLASAPYRLSSSTAYTGWKLTFDNRGSTSVNARAYAFCGNGKTIAGPLF